jgi:DinB family protein
MLALSRRPVKRASTACKTSRMTTSDTQPAARLAASRAAFAALAPRIRAGEPWPLAEQFGTEPEASWGPREVLAHTAEMLPFWLGEYERVAEAGKAAGDPLPFGRTAADSLRIGILERDRTLPLRELFDRIDAGIDRWERRLDGGSAADDNAAGLHSRLGEMSAGELRDRFVCTHLEEHLEQLEGILGRG